MAASAAVWEDTSLSRPAPSSAADQPVAHVFSRFVMPLRRAHRTQRGRTERHNPHHCLKPAEHCQPTPMGCKIKKVGKLESYGIVTDRLGGGAISSAPGTRMWCRLRDLNPRPTDYKSVALPAELSRHSLEIIASPAGTPASGLFAPSWGSPSGLAASRLRSKSLPAILLNPRPTDYKSVALPAELSRPRVCEERYSNVLAFFAESLKNTAPRGETPALSVHAPRPQAVNRCRSGEIGLLSEG